MFPYTMKNFCGMIIPVLIETLNSRKKNNGVALLVSQLEQGGALAPVSENI